MKKQIVDALKLKFKNLGLSEKVLESMATMLEPTVTEESQIETAIAGVEPILKAIQGDADKVRGEKAAAERAKKELEDKIKTLTGAEPTPEPNNPSNPEPENPLMAKLFGAIDKLSNEISSLKGEKVETGRKAQLEKVIEKLPENLRSPYKRMALKDLSDDDFTNQLKEIETEVEETVTGLKTQGLTFKPASGGGGEPPKNQLSKEDIEAFQKQL